MNIWSPKAWVAALWIAALATLGLTIGTTSIAAWLGLIALAVIPIGVLRTLWQSPAQTTSESINDAIR
jgi:hypothetical protein